MINIKAKNIYYICLMLFPLLCLIFTINANAISEQKNKGPLSKPEKLLNILKWEDLYKAERKRDVAYLLGSIDGNDLQGLTLDQKRIITISLQNIVIEQMLEDKIYLKKYLITQYGQFFTPDELNKLIQYFNTELMQMIIGARITQTSLSPAEIRNKIISSNRDDKKIISSMANSYLYNRYQRFQQKVAPLVQEKIVTQFKAALSYAFDQIPLLVENIKNNQKDNIQIDG